MPQSQTAAIPRHKEEEEKKTKKKKKKKKSRNRTNVRKAPRLALSSPSEVIASLKGLKNARTKHRHKTNRLKYKLQSNKEKDLHRDHRLRTVSRINCMKYARIYSIYDNCDRQSTLWRSDKSIGILSGQTGFKAHVMRDLFFQLCFILVFRHSCRKTELFDPCLIHWLRHVYTNALHKCSIFTLLSNLNAKGH